MSWIDRLTFDARGLLPVVAQDARTGEVLMLAWANAQALRLTLETGRAHYWSRSRGELWAKGQTSGNTQEIVDVRVDCDADAVLYRVRQSGPACHTGERSCFHRLADGSDGSWGDAPDPRPMLARLEDIIAARDAERPEGSYTAYLFAQGIDKILKKVGEEATETVIAAKNGDNAELRAEAADLLFHLMVLWRARGLDAAEVWDELDRRFGQAPRPGSAEGRPSRAGDGT
ncbi:MAG TPA: bifunctional phosphoribosyl-AMP cyclohydrolase/phosphoribosyl-ATP diphosphatase HisIE [Longimicrobium sp.]|nr:bifunctional phosphoribosyl-AMP cyclohydrolase/phosphoribosyl-ATP diphosphatase HisIE [Longimicrobium sp.]